MTFSHSLKSLGQFFITLNEMNDIFVVVEENDILRVYNSTPIFKMTPIQSWPTLK